MKTTDLSKLSAEQLKAELAKREQQTKEDREAYKALVNETVPTLMGKMKQVAEGLSEVKLGVFESLKILLDTKQEAYSVRDTQQSHSFSDSNGNTIVYGFRVLEDWDDTVNAGISKVKEFLKTLATDEKNSKLVDAINRLLKQDTKGNLKASRVLELTKLAEEFNNDTFTDAVEIIRKSYKPVRSKFFVECIETDEQGVKKSIPLSVTTAPFPPGVDVSALFPVHENFLP